MKAQLQIAVRNGTEPVEVSFVGDIDSATEGQVVEALSWLAAKEVIVDLAGVDFIDSSGIRALVIGHRAAEAAGGSLALRGPSPQAARVLDMTGVSERITIIERSRFSSESSTGVESEGRHGGNGR